MALKLTVAILDILKNSATKIERKQLQLVGVVAMFIASKYKEMFAPEIGDFVHITDCAYTEFQIGNGNQNAQNRENYDPNVQNLNDVVP